MAEWKHRGLLYLFQLLVYCKRGAFWSGRVVGTMAARGVVWAARRVGFLAFRAGFKLGRNLDLSSSFVIRAGEFFSSALFLRVLMVACALLLVFPETRLHARPLRATTGSNAVLLAMLGPGEEYFVEEYAPPPPDADIDGLEAQNIGVGAYAPTEGYEEGTDGFDIPDLASITGSGNYFNTPLIITGAAAGANRREILKYNVQPGDTISSIAQKFGISVQTVLWANNFSYYSVIRPGQEITILPVSGIVHKVARGETIASVAKKYKVTPEDILDANRITDARLVAVGDELLVPGGVKATVASAPAVSQPRVSGSAAGASPLAGSGEYIWPAASRRITQYFSWRHTGVDIGAPTGTAIYAARAGRVTLSQCGWNGGYGCHIRIDHGNGITTLYAHASKLFVRVGDYVEQGQNIAAIGSTGRSTGPHLHFEVRSGGRRLNPLLYTR